MDRIELASQLISKGVELLDESYGAHGTFGKAMEERYKKIKAENDKYDAKIEKKREQYKRAGYEDMAPPKASRERENSYLNSIEDDKKLRQVNNSRAYAKSDKNKRDILNRSAANEIYDYLTDKESLNRLTDKQKALHGRINKRTQNETVADLLTEAAYLLSLVDNDD